MTDSRISLMRLMAHDVRLSLRLFSRKRMGPHTPSDRGFVLGVSLAVGAFLCLIAFGLAEVIAQYDVKTAPQSQIMLTGVSLILFLMMLAQALNRASQVFFTRGDFWLLLSAPIEVRKVLTMRALAMIIPVLGFWGVFLWPLSLMLMLIDGAHWGMIMPLIVAMALCAVAFAFILLSLLFLILGPQRTRMGAQILSVVMTIIAFLSLQYKTILPQHSADYVSDVLVGLSRAQQLNGEGLMWLPAHILLGDIRACAELLLVTILFFGVVMSVFGQGLARHVLQAINVASRAPAAPMIAQKPKPFRGGIILSLVLKEWRLIMRDPWLLGHILVQIIYVTPVGLMLWKSFFLGAESSAAASIAGLVPVLTIIAGLAWITLSGEDAPHFIMTAPVSARMVRSAKLISAFAPVVVCVMPFCIAIAFISLSLAGLTFIGSLCAAVLCVLINLWAQRPSPRRSFGYRHHGSIIANISETTVNYCTYFCVVAIIWRSIWGLVPLLIGMGAVVMVYRWARKIHKI
jgi:ABC-2 type transport system permease protein